MGPFRPPVLAGKLDPEETKKAAGARVQTVLCVLQNWKERRPGIRMRLCFPYIIKPLCYLVVSRQTFLPLM